MSPPQCEIPEENAHKKTRGEWAVVKTQPTSEEFAAMYHRKRSSSSSGGALLVHDPP